jgi:hypothetical protein
MHWNSTLPKRKSVGVKKARVPYTLRAASGWLSVAFGAKRKWRYHHSHAPLPTLMHYFIEHVLGGAMDYAKLLARGVGAWVQYEWACDHSGLFSEKYLAQPIGHILAGQSKNRASAEYTHTILSAHMKGPGKRPAVDFVVFGKYPKIEIAIESKWFGTNPTSRKKERRWL